MNTKLLYLENFNLLISSACVIAIHRESDKSIIILDQTIFYPQGSGQPYDKGIKDKMSELCRHVPAYIPADKPSRVVMYGNFGVPCGGTHVNNLADIGTITIRKLKMEKGNIRVSYEIN